MNKFEFLMDKANSLDFKQVPSPYFIDSNTLPTNHSSLLEPTHRLFEGGQLMARSNESQCEHFEKPNEFYRSYALDMTEKSESTPTDTSLDEALGSDTLFVAQPFPKYTHTGLARADLIDRHHQNFDSTSCSDTYGAQNFLTHDFNGSYDLGFQNPHQTPTHGIHMGSVPKSSLSSRLQSRLATPKRTKSEATPGARGRIAPEDDWYNREIKRLRAEECLSWGDIAHRLNQVKAEQDKPPTFTEAAVYGRFVRNAPRIAAANGEHDFVASDWMHFRKRKDSSGGYRPAALAGRDSIEKDTNSAKDLTSPADYTHGLSLTKFTADDDAQLADIYRKVFQDLWNEVAERMTAATQKPFDAASCCHRMSHL